MKLKTVGIIALWVAFFLFFGGFGKLLYNLWQLEKHPKQTIEVLAQNLEK